MSLADGLGSGNRAPRRASERTRGAQNGHKGSSRAMLDEREVDQIIDCVPPEVCECGASVLVGSEPLRHQVFDVPPVRPVRPVVNEYRLFSGCCTGCGEKHRASLPAGVPAGQIGRPTTTPNAPCAAS